MADRSPKYAPEIMRPVASAYRAHRQAGSTELDAYRAAVAAYVGATGDDGNAPEAAGRIVAWVSMDHGKWLWNGVVEVRGQRAL